MFTTSAFIKVEKLTSKTGKDIVEMQWPQRSKAYSEWQTGLFGEHIWSICVSFITYQELIYV